MKQLCTICLMAVLSISVNGQTQIRKGALLSTLEYSGISGNTDYRNVQTGMSFLNTGKSFNYGLTLKASYFLGKQTALGLTWTYAEYGEESSSRNNSDVSTYETRIYSKSYAIFSNRYFELRKNLSVFAGLQFGHRFGKFNTEQTYNGQQRPYITGHQRAQFLDLDMGILWFPFKNLGFNFSSSFLGYVQNKSIYDNASRETKNNSFRFGSNNAIYRLGINYMIGF